MIPNRGLRWPSQSLGIGKKRLEPLCRRSLSSSTTPNVLRKSSSPFTKPGALSCKAVARPRILLAPLTLHNGAFQRNQSTSAILPDKAKSIPPGTETTPVTSTESAFKDINDVIDLSSLTLQDAPVHIGYLKSLGLDFGYGPTSIMQWALEHVHVLAGTPWWASIVITAVALRLAVFHLMVGSADNSAKMATIKHITEPIYAKMRAASARKDSAETWKWRGELKLINERAGIKVMRSFYPMIQVPLGFGTFILLRAMAKLPVPGLETGGLLWFPNLTIPDPTFLLPIATSGILHWVLKTGGETGAGGQSAQLIKVMSYALPALSLIFTSWLPASIQLSFFVTGLFSYFQSNLFRWPAFRTLLSMTPLPPKVDTTLVLPSPNIVPSKPTTRFGGSNDPEPTILSKLTKPLKDSMASVQNSARESIKSAKQYTGQERGPDGRRSKREIQEAERYEKKRQLEERRRLEEWDEERRRRREIKQRERRS